MDYYCIELHAICSDTSTFPESCLYCQLSTEEPSEARFVPQDSSHLNTIYSALCEGAELHPDPEEEGEGDFMFNENEVFGFYPTKKRSIKDLQKTLDFNI